MLYKLKSGRHTRIEGVESDGTPNRVRYRPGDIIDLNRDEAAKMGERVHPHVPHIDDPVDDAEVLAAAAEVEPAQDTDGEPDAPAEVEEAEEDAVVWGVEDLTVGQVEELVSGLDDAADLRAVYAEEEAGKQRVGVFNAVRYRLAAITDPEPEAEADEADAGEPDDSTE